jgi:hypothetical protein
VRNELTAKDAKDAKVVEGMKPKKPEAPLAAADHEAEFVAAFVVSEKRTRYLEFLANPKRRPEILDRLNHFFDFVPKFATEITAHSVTEVVRLLRAKDAPDVAHIIADSSEWDGLDLHLSEAVGRAMSHEFGVVVSCIPGRLAFYKQEAPGKAFILQRNE